MSYDQDEGFDFDDGFKMSSFEEDDEGDDFSADEPIPLDDYEDDDPDSRYT